MKTKVTGLVILLAVIAVAVVYASVAGIFNVYSINEALKP